MEHSNLSGLSRETFFCVSNGTHQLLEFIAQHIADLPNVDFTLLKHYYVKRRAEYYLKRGLPIPEKYQLTN